MSYNKQTSLGEIIGMHTTYMADRTPYQVSGYYDIEFRHPFYDRTLIEFALTLPPYMKDSKGVGKVVLREAMKKKLVKLVYERTDKGEYTPSIEHQLQVILGENIVKFHQIKKLDILSQSVLNTKYKDDVWSLIGLEYWLKHHFS